jgi:hypothetical protein
MGNAPNNHIEVAPLRVVLAAYSLDGEVGRAVALFEQVLQGHCDAQCRLMDLAIDDIASERSTDVDCIVLFNRGLHIARRWTDFGSGWLQNSEIFDGGEPVEVEIAPAARWHRLVDGVEPFATRCPAVPDALIPQNACPLLIDKTSGVVRPMAWVRPDGRYGGVVSTSLGRFMDLRQPGFVRFLLNALTWIVERDY